MDILKKVKNSFSKVVYVHDSGEYGDVYTMDIHGFGNAYNYEPVDTDRGEEMFRTLLKRLYHEVLNKDPYWHYFMEGSYNHIRFSLKFWEDIEEILELHEVKYSNWKIWVDDQEATRKYQNIFKNLFHWFSVMAVEGYPEDEINMILDRVIHCFMNHQQLYLLEHRKDYGVMVEPYLVAKYAANRAKYIGYCEGVGAVKKGYEKWAQDARDSYLDDCRAKRKAMEDYRESTEGLMEIIAEMEPEEAKEVLREHKESLDKIKEESEEI